MSNGNLKSTYLEKGDDWFSVEIFNYSGADKLVKDCPIGRITYDFSGDLKIYLAEDYLLNDKTLDQFIKDYKVVSEDVQKNIELTQITVSDEYNNLSLHNICENQQNA